MTWMFSKSQDQLIALRSASFPSSPVHLQGHLPPCSSSPIANLEVRVSFLLPSLSWRPPNMEINSTLLEMVPCYKIHIFMPVGNRAPFWFWSSAISEPKSSWKTLLPKPTYPGLPKAFPTWMTQKSPFLLSYWHQMPIL